MNMTTNREERKLQKQILKDLFFDYDAKHHDAFIIRYNKFFDDKMLHNYMVERGLISQMEHCEMDKKRGGKK